VIGFEAAKKKVSNVEEITKKKMVFFLSREIKRLRWRMGTRTEIMLSALPFTWKEYGETAEFLCADTYAYMRHCGCTTLLNTFTTIVIPTLVVDERWRRLERIDVVRSTFTVYITHLAQSWRNLDSLKKARFHLKMNKKENVRVLVLQREPPKIKIKTRTAVGALISQSSACSFAFTAS
jgi:hypothetical protein